LLNTLEKAIEKQQEIALIEGRSMLNFLENSISLCRKSLQDIAKLIPEFKEELLDKFTQNIEDLLKEKLVDSDMRRILMEVSLYMDKNDISEEIVRIEDHFDKFYNMMHSNKLEKGKALNFILQEMHREINTIGSKFNHKEAVEHILLVKEEIEKCREIVQNVE